MRVVAGSVTRIWGFPRALLFVSIALITGCASDAYLRSAQSLATSGGAFAASTGDTFASMRNSLDTYVADEEMLGALKPNQFSPPTSTELAQIKILGDALDARVGVMHQLARTYATFNALASYDASGEAEGAIGKLTGAVNAYATALKKSGISSTTDIVLQAGGGAILREAQVSRIKQASALIRTRLESFRDLLSAESATYKNVQEALIRTQTRTSIALYEIGIGSPHPILAELMATPGFEYRVDEKQLKALKNDQRTRLNDGIEKIVERRVTKQIALEQVVIDDTQDGIAALITEHKKLEAGQVINLATVSAITEQFTAILDRINAARSGKPAAAAQ